MASVFLALHAVHLTADFPNHSPWMDWAKYTDEGWYGDAAIRHFQRGQWYVYGDFNPAAALPVWPLVELAVFRFTGVSLVAARGLTVGIFALILLASYRLLRRWRTGATSLAPASAVLLLAVSPFCFVFTRMAILEPLLVLLMLLALLAASAAPDRLDRLDLHPLRRHLPEIALGVLLPLMVLTKTTAVFLLPSIAWLLWSAAHFRVRPFLHAVARAGGLSLALWVGYFLLFVHPHFLADYRYLFSANAYTSITAENAAKVLKDTIKDGMWIGRALYPLSLVAGLGAVLLLRRQVSPVVTSLLLWAGGYAVFLAYHNNLQPRYYLVVAVPLTLVLPFAGEQLVSFLSRSVPAFRAAAWAAAIAVLAVIVVPDARQTIGYVRHPEYTFVSAAEKVRRIVDSEPTQSRLILSISGSDLSLMTGLPSICDDFGTMELAERVATYHPGWYVTWNQVDDDKMEALSPLYRLERVSAIPAYDDPDRNLLIVYRLDPHDKEPPRPRRHRAPVPKLLQTRLGQQPSTTQLEH